MRSPKEVFNEVKTEVMVTAAEVATGTHKFSRDTKVCAVVGGVIGAGVYSPQLVLAETPSLFTNAADFLKDYYGYIVGISTAVALFITAVCAIWMMFAPNGRESQTPWTWLKRTWVIWIFINSMGAILKIFQAITKDNGMTDAQWS